MYRRALDVATSLYPLRTDSTNAILLSWTENASDSSESWVAGFWQGTLAFFAFFFFILPVAYALWSN